MLCDALGLAGPGPVGRYGARALCPYLNRGAARSISSSGRRGTVGMCICKTPTAMPTGTGSWGTARSCGIPCSRHRRHRANPRLIIELRDKAGVIPSARTWPRWVLPLTRHASTGPGLNPATGPCTPDASGPVGRRPLFCNLLIMLHYFQTVVILSRIRAIGAARSNNERAAFRMETEG